MLNIQKKRIGELRDLFWPEFVAVRGCVFVKFQYEANQQLFDAASPMQSESDVNHTHILGECFAHSAATRKKPFFDVKHPDFLRACEIGRAICRLWASKLINDFPHYDFRVYYHGLDPVVRFHKIRTRTANWAEAKCFRKEIKNGEMLILDTRILKKQKT